MKTLIKSLVILITLSTFFVSCVEQDGPLGNLDSVVAETRSSVEPVLYSNWQSGDAAFEANEIGADCDFAWKIDDNAPDGTYALDSNEYENTPVDFDAEFTVSNSDGYTFDWSSNYQVCAVIVKAGTHAYVYYYPEGSCGDTALSAPINPNNGKVMEISHVTIAFSDVPCTSDLDNCYQEETAWSEGPTYTPNGNWAMYTPYPGSGESVDIIAGQNMLAGTVTFNDNGDGTIDLLIELTNDFIFYYDMGDEEADENLKVQDYDSAPNGNPKIGKFDHKATLDVGSTSYTMTVPLNDYYGIHLDVAFAVSCP